jgi:hypothetical protein
LDNTTMHISVQVCGWNRLHPGSWIWTCRWNSWIIWSVYVRPSRKPQAVFQSEKHFMFI